MRTEKKSKEAVERAVEEFRRTLTETILNKESSVVFSICCNSRQNMHLLAGQPVDVVAALCTAFAQDERFLSVCRAAIEIFNERGEEYKSRVARQSNLN
jgi:hypothetical protein